MIRGIPRFVCVLPYMARGIHIVVTNKILKRVASAIRIIPATSVSWQQGSRPLGTSHWCPRFGSAPFGAPSLLR